MHLANEVDMAEVCRCIWQMVWTRVKDAKAFGRWCRQELIQGKPYKTALFSIHRKARLLAPHDTNI